MQKIVVILVILAAVSYLVRRFFMQRSRKKPGCDKCGK